MFFLLMQRTKSSFDEEWNIAKQVLEFLFRDATIKIVLW